jgi:hypothetical protein
MSYTIFKTHGYVDASSQKVNLEPTHSGDEYYIWVDNVIVGYAHVYDLAKVIFPDDPK